MKCILWGSVEESGGQECVSSLGVDTDLSRFRGLQKTPERVPSDDWQTAVVLVNGHRVRRERFCLSTWNCTVSVSPRVGTSCRFVRLKTGSARANERHNLLQDR